MQRFKNILVASNPEGASDALIARAEWLAHSNGAAVTIVDVIDSSPGEFARMFSALSVTRARDVETKVIDFHRNRMDELAAPLRRAGLDVVTKLLQGIGFIEVIRHVLRHDNDLVLKAADRAPVRQILGGPDLHLLRKCPCPVWILNSAAEPNSRRIAAAVNPDPEEETSDQLNHKVMQLATSLARQNDARLDVVHAWYMYEEPAMRSSLVKTPAHEIEAMLGKIERESAARLHELTDQYSEFADLMEVIHVKGIPANVVTEHVENERIDTLVMGTLGRSGLAGLFIGNTADTVLNRVGCSVLAVKPEGFVSPVTLENETAS